MSLRRRPTVMPALLAANRADARKSTGPRTVEGKNRVVLNALQEGRHARNFGENLRRAKSQGEAELFQWMLDQVRAAFRLHGWQEEERKAERLAQRVWCELEREERRLHALARRLGNGRVRFPRRTATLWALPWTPRRWGGLGTNPEYAVKSTDRFLTSLSRMQVEIKEGAGAEVLGAAEFRSAAAAMGRGDSCGIGPSLSGRRAQTRGKRGKRWECERSQRSRGGSQRVGTNPECAPESTDSILTTLTRIRSEQRRRASGGCSGHVAAARAALFQGGEGIVSSCAERGLVLPFIGSVTYCCHARPVRADIVCPTAKPWGWRRAPRKPSPPRAHNAVPCILSPRAGLASEKALWPPSASARWATL
jgi:hypothetical protein